MNVEVDVEESVERKIMSVPMTKDLREALTGVSKMLGVRPSRLVAEMLVEFIPVIRSRQMDKIKALKGTHETSI